MSRAGSWTPGLVLFLFWVGLRGEYERQEGLQVGRSGGSPVKIDGQAAVFKESEDARVGRLFAPACKEDGWFGRG